MKMNAWEKEIQASGWIHWPLPLHAERSLEAEGQAKEVLDQRRLRLAPEAWTAVGECTVEGDGASIRVARRCTIPAGRAAIWSWGIAATTGSLARISMCPEKIGKRITGFRFHCGLFAWASERPVSACAFATMAP